MRNGCELHSDEVGSVPPGTLLRVLERRAVLSFHEPSSASPQSAAQSGEEEEARTMEPVARARVAREGTSEPLGWVSCVDSDGMSNLVPAWTAASATAEAVAGAADYLRDYRMTHAMTTASRRHQAVEL